MQCPQFPEFRGRAKAEWIEGSGNLVIRDEVEAGELPSGTWIVGADDSSGDCICLYADSRGVRRIYQMSFASGVWRIWRDAPGFNQRFTGKLERVGQVITALWETSKDGTRWEKDFDLTYRRVT
jgi:hypothetical protein